MTGRNPVTRRQRLLCELVADLLRVSDVGLDDGFVALGGDSIIAMQLVSRARKAGLRITVGDVLSHRDMEALAEAATTVDRESAPVADDGVGPVAATPVMRWFRERGGGVDTYNQFAVLRTPPGLTETRLVSMVQALLDHHDVLRLRLSVPGGEKDWVLETLPAGTVDAAPAVRRIDAAGRLECDRAALVRQESDAARDRLRPREGNVLQAVWFDAGPDRRGELALVVHHLAVDSVSWRVLIADLAAAWRAVEEDAAVALEPVPTSFRRWSRLLGEQAHAQECVAELPYWLERLRPGAAGFGDRARVPGDDRESRDRCFTESLPAEFTEELLTTVPALFNADVNDILLAGLALAMGDWHRGRGTAGDGTALLHLEGHGREAALADVDLSRTVGWFTSMFPIRLELGEVDWADVDAAGPAVGTAVKRIKEQVRGIPDKGVRYGLLRYLNPRTGALLEQAARPEFVFNYLGRFAVSDDADWSVVPEYGTGLDDAGPGMPMAHSIEVNAATVDRADGPVLQATWTWAGGVVSEADTRELAETWFRMLRTLVAHARRPGAGGLTPSDLTLSSLSQRELEEIESDLRAV
ncbi:MULTISPECIES: condensation domain-containing protein [Streptomyces]|uniref:Condensation domain-containing protein n=1 Tax=Streptomyces sudanensis TaxID=436397 RepID=A0ABY4T8J4_9ACTN|nr:MULTISPECIES: condensation domain-containing protein [Streptomyces]URN14600.1 condensation domain-containing protein [Streptomyces sudanensis]